MYKADKPLSIMIMLLSTIFFILTFQLPEAIGQDVGAAFFPRVISLLLFLFGFILFFLSLKIKDHADDNKSIKVPLITIVILVIYLVSINFIGFIISTPIFLFVFLYYLKVRKWTPLILLPLTVNLFIYVLFEMLLKVPLPRGIFI